mmetsp:Transcript_31696/g.44168  ORF Transcript_31696/g.44168 Transcript_31696/m.44168 type:complete len:113 (-) Transcript_31696:328-666(-)|eukprot:CAMPEP_0185278656 /NCGR_PEP_ID=MMETSP1359-20130426/61567_1 /TAXON_ID=552665 /ORGANISM="Bigelowiella longifila, Strain CCMP242" /LENGTH=112 /DNA_ID=CAMNT_0027873257 /DNA_START=166 /DNA_END=504 /DNA_ORIENTATION=+
MSYPYASKDATPSHADYIVKVMTESFCGTQIDRIQRCKNAVTPDPMQCKLPLNSLKKCEFFLTRNIAKTCNPQFIDLTKCMKTKDTQACQTEYDTMYKCFVRNIRSGASTKY